LTATFYTIIALVAFATNSLLCRMALMEGAIDPWNFTILRLLSGAICLGIIIIFHTHRLKHQTQTVTSFNSDFNTDNNNAAVAAILADKGSWLSSISLVVYALCFSLAYVDLDTGTGALILFAAVQLTMIGWGIYQKEQLTVLQWLALACALIGFVYLMLPSAAIPSFTGALTMALSGIAWGIYSIRGKACLSPLRATGFNFIRSLVAIPFLLIVAISHWVGISMQGVVLAVISGAITSGLGYCMWYVAMPLLKNTQAAVVQLCVPIIAALAGVLFLSETLSLRFIIASIVILGAVLVFVLNKKPNNYNDSAVIVES